MPHRNEPTLRLHYGAYRSDLPSLNSSAVTSPFMVGLLCESLAAPFQSPLRSLWSLVTPSIPLSAPVVPLRSARSPPYTSQKVCANQSLSVSPQTPLSRPINQHWGETALRGNPALLKALMGCTFREPRPKCLPSDFPPSVASLLPPPKGGSIKSIMEKMRKSIISLVYYVLKFGYPQWPNIS